MAGGLCLYTVAARSGLVKGEPDEHFCYHSGQEPWWGGGHCHLGKERPGTEGISAEEGGG